MNKIHFIAAALAIIALSGCTKEVENSSISSFSSMSGKEVSAVTELTNSEASSLTSAASVTSLITTSNINIETDLSSNSLPEVVIPDTTIVTTAPTTEIIIYEDDGVPVIEEKKETTLSKETIILEDSNSIEDSSSNNDSNSDSDSENFYWDGDVLSAWAGTVYGPSGKETYYNLDMSGVVSIMRGLGYDEYSYPYWIRYDGCKMLGDYIIIAADLSIRPRGTILPTSLGWGIVCDTGGFIYSNQYQIDIATTW